MFCFVEGQDDEIFFKHILLQSEKITFYQFAKKTSSQVNKLINSLNSMNEPYLFFADSDGNTIYEKKKKILEKFPRVLPANLFIVQYEIESWFLAGVNQALSDTYHFKKYYKTTNSVTKEMFLDCISLVRDTRLNILLKILAVYNCSLAENRNNSFASFYHYNQSICI